MSVVARPMDWPYLCTAEPEDRSRTASLWLRGTSPGSTSSPAAVSTRVPAFSSRVVTATSSSGRNRRAHSASGTTEDPSVRVTTRCSFSEGDIGLPVVHRAVEQPIHREVRRGVLESGGRRLVELDAQTGVLAGVQQPVDERVAHLENPERALDRKSV